MKSHLETGLGLMIQEVGKEKATKQTLNNCVKDPAEAKILALMDVWAPLLPTDDEVLSVVETVKNEYVK